MIEGKPKESKKGLGVNAVRAQYNGGTGEEAIDLYVQLKAQGLSRAEIIDRMAQLIDDRLKAGKMIGLNHVADPTKRLAIDISPTTITNNSRFVDTILAESRIDGTRFFSFVEGKPGYKKAEKAFHIEIPQ